jgi:diguanylate cyclase (GGDEF)-like protein
LVIEDDPLRLDALCLAMDEEGYETFGATPSGNLSEVTSQFQPDVVLLGITPTQSESYELCGELRTLEALRHSPIVLVSSAEADDEHVARGLLAGADDFIPWGRPLELRARMAVRLRNKRYRDALRRVRGQRDVLLQQATVDPLTGVMNRRALEAAVSSLVQSGAMFGFLFLDIDHFKSINDRFGHDAGDQVLRGMADYVKRAIRSGDYCGRFGGEEFVILVHGADEEVAQRVAERHRIGISRIRYSKIGPNTAVTVSIGVAIYDPAQPDSDMPALARRADSALYEAKRLGRNQVVMAAPVRVGAESIASEPPGLAPVVSIRAEEPMGRSAAPESPRRVSLSPAGEAVEQELLRKLDGGRTALPVLPIAAAEALKLAAGPDADLVRLATLLDRDPHFAARFLSLANSVIYSRGIRTTNMRDAIMRIGLAASRDLLFQIVYAASTFGVPRFQDAVSRSFQRSVLSALAARTVVQVLHRSHPYAYLIGLLHDIGEARVYRILASIPAAPRVADVVEQLVARYHCRAGAELATAWQLPSDIVEVCADHHAVPTPQQFHVRLAVAADALVEASHLDANRALPEVLVAPVIGIGVSVPQIQDMLPAIRAAARTLDG